MENLYFYVISYFRYTIALLKMKVSAPQNLKSLYLKLK